LSAAEIAAPHCRIESSNGGVARHDDARVSARRRRRCRRGADREVVAAVEGRRIPGDDLAAGELVEHADVEASPTMKSVAPSVMRDAEVALSRRPGRAAGAGDIVKVPIESPPSGPPRYPEHAAVGDRRGA
jgi:hypothetical protein